MDCSRQIFLFGPTKSGKTTLSHALSSSPLLITKEAYEYSIQAYENTDKDRVIGNYAESETAKPVYYCNDTICDFPGFEDTRGDEYNLRTLLLLYELFQNREKIRIAFCIEEGNIRTSNASIFLRMSQKLVDLLQLTKDDLSGICIIITKSSAHFCQDLSRNFQRLFPRESNCIIEGIKSQSVNIKPFWLPVENGANILLEDSNVKEIMETFNNIKELDCLEMTSRILPNILAVLDTVYRKNPNESGIVYLSNIERSISFYKHKFTSKSILCIDKDLNINSEQLIFEVPYVIVSTNLNHNEKRIIKIQGYNPVVSFLNVGKILNGCNLIISTQNSQNIVFPDPTTNEFDAHSHFFRIESICINGFMTEYMTYNNIFLDLIAYINPAVGRVLIDPCWNVSVATFDKRLKLFTNECMRTKDSIKNAYKSLKEFENIEEYLIACKGSSNSELKSMLEEHAVNIPSIFQLMMSHNLNSLDSKSGYLISVRDLLIGKYLTMISEFIREKNEIKKNERNLQALNYFLFEFNQDARDFDKAYKEIEQRLKDRLSQNVPKENFRNLFYFYDVLSTTDDKFELYECGLTGDKSIYPNFQALKNLYYHSRTGNSSKSMLPGYVNKAIIKVGVALVSRVAVQRVAIQLAARASAKAAAKMTARGAGKLAIKRASNRAAAGILKTATTIGSFAGTAFLFAFELTANALMSKFKSGYLEGEHRIGILELD